MNGPQAAVTAPHAWRAIQEARLAEELRWARRAPFFAARLPSHDQVGLETLTEIEPYSKADILANPDGMNAVGVPAVRQYWTSGTTGRGQERLRLGPLDEYIVPACHQYQFSWAGLRPGEALGLTWPAAVQAGGQILRQAAEHSGIQPVELGALRSTSEKIRYAAKTGVAGIVASPLYVLRLVSEGLSTASCPSLRLLFVAGESHPPGWDESVRSLGFAPYEWYGITQAGPLAIACTGGHGSPYRRLHIPPHLYLVEVLTDDGAHAAVGQEGRIIVTALARHAAPAVRYDTGDAGTWLGWVRCPACGRSWPSLEAGSIRRTDDMMRVRGVNVWPAAFEEVLFAVPDLVDYRGRIYIDESDRERIAITVEMRDDAPVPEGIVSALRDATGLGVDVQATDEHLATQTFKQRRWVDERAGSLLASKLTIASAPPAAQLAADPVPATDAVDIAAPAAVHSDDAGWAELHEHLAGTHTAAPDAALPETARALMTSHAIARRVIEDPAFVLSVATRQWIVDLWNTQVPPDPKTTS